MKISHEQKTIVRRKLLETAVTLFTEKGFSAATMREISTRAGFSPGTVYSYFPTKERIYFAYFEWRQEQVFEELARIEGFEAFDFKESIQTFLELLLESFLPDREFVSGAFRAMMDSPMRSFSDLRPARQEFCAWVQTRIEYSGTIAEANPAFLSSFFSNLIDDYKNLIIIHWLDDKSEGFHRTSHLIHLSLDLLSGILESGMIPKTLDVIIFLLKGHLFGNAEHLFRLISPILSSAREENKSVPPEPARSPRKRGSRVSRSTGKTTDIPNSSPKAHRRP